MNDNDIDPALNPELDQVSRRSFLEQMGTSTFAAAFLGPEALGREKTPASLEDKLLVHEKVTFESNAQRVEAFLCRPKTEGKRGSVIVVHEIFGLNSHIQDIACRFAGAGFNSLAINFFTREGKVPDSSAGFQPIMEFVGKIPDTQIVGDVDSAARYLRHRNDSNGKVGIVGFCWGGRVSMLSAETGRSMDAAVAYYGRIRTAATANQPASVLDLAAQADAPILGHFGRKDTGIPVADVEALKDALQQHSKTAEFHVHEAAGHAFNNDTRPSYHEESATTAWRRTLEWFDNYLK